MVRDEEFVRLARKGLLTENDVAREANRLRLLRARRGLQGLIRAIDEAA